MATPNFLKEGYIPFHGYRTWYRIVGENEKSDKPPLLCLHGGPGASWDYFEPLEALISTGRQVVFYDQLGGGNSDVPNDSSIYSMNLYVEEVKKVRLALGLEEVHILGQSWGGMLAMEYALTQPMGLRSLILADTSASMPQWASEAKRLVSELPIGIQPVLKKHEEAGTTDSTEYLEAWRIFSQKHILSLYPRPDYWQRMADKPGEDVYHAMWGLSEINITGNLKDWNIRNRLGEIHVPTLILCGRFDEATPVLAETIHQGIQDSEFVIFENSEHMPHITETERYLQVLNNFLLYVEKPYQI